MKQEFKIKPISFFSLNCFLVPGYVKSGLICKKQKKRANLISEHLKEYQIISLQENWGGEKKKKKFLSVFN